MQLSDMSDVTLKEVLQSWLREWGLIQPAHLSPIGTGYTGTVTPGVPANATIENPASPVAPDGSLKWITPAMAKTMSAEDYRKYCGNLSAETLNTLFQMDPEHRFYGPRYLLSE